MGNTESYSNFFPSVTTDKTFYYNLLALYFQDQYTRYQILTIEIDLSVMSCDIKFYSIDGPLWSADPDNLQFLQLSAIPPTASYIRDDWKKITEVTQGRQRIVTMLESDKNDRGTIASLRCRNTNGMGETSNPTPIFVRHDFHFR